MRDESAHLGYVSPEVILQFPKATERKNRIVKKKVKTRIMIDTPEKIELEKAHKEKEDKKAEQEKKKNEREKKITKKKTTCTVTQKKTPPPMMRQKMAWRRRTAENRNGLKRRK